MKVTYKFTKKLFDLSPKRHEFTVHFDTNDLIKYIHRYESALANAVESKYNVELISDKLKTKENLDEIHFNDKLIWHYRDGFTRNWELFKLENILRD